MSLNFLKEMKINAMLYLLQTAQSVTKIDKLLTLDVHNISAPTRICSPYTLRFKGSGLLGKFCYGDWRRNNPVSFPWWMHHYSSKRSSCSWIKVHFHLSCSPTWRIVQILFWRLSYEIFQRCLCEISGRACRQYLHVLKFRGYNWWIAVILGFKIKNCRTIGDYDGFELECSVLSWRQIGTRRRWRITRKSRSLLLCWSKFS